MAEIKVESLLGQTEEQTKQEYKNYALSKLKKKFVCSLLKGGVSPDKIKETLLDAYKNNYNSVLALPSYISHIAKSISGEGIGVGVVLGYPFGENTIDATLSEIKKWAKSKVDEIVVVLPISDIKFNKCKNTEKILKTLYSISKKKITSVMFDACKLNDTELQKVSKIVADYKVKRAYISTSIYKDGYEERSVNAVISARKNQDTLVACFGEIADCQTVMDLLTKCDLFVTDKATEFVEEIKNKIEV